MKIIMLCLAVLIMSGCATTGSKDTQSMTNVVVDSKTANKYVFPSDEAMKFCVDELPILQGKLSGDLYKWGFNSSQTYYTCRDSQKSLVNWINNLKKEVK